MRRNQQILSRTGQHRNKAGQFLPLPKARKLPLALDNEIERGPNYQHPK
jgi:hypothetical protein